MDLQNVMWLQRECWKIYSKICDKSFSQREEEHTGYHNSKFIYGLKKATRWCCLKFKWNNMKFWVFQKLRRTIAFKKKLNNGESNFHTLNEDNILLSSGGVNVLLQIKNYCPQVLISVMSFHSMNWDSSR